MTKEKCETTIMPTDQFPKIQGYYCVIEKTIYCPAIIIDDEGKGYLREFVNWSKDNFDCVKFPSLISPKLEMILKHYGFHMTKEFHEEMGEDVPVAVWNKNNSV